METQMARTEFSKLQETYKEMLRLLLHLEKTHQTTFLVSVSLEVTENAHDPIVRHCPLLGAIRTLRSGCILLI